MIVTILAFIFVFGILVFVHELGHFLAAKFFKVRVEEFAFGFPPRIWSTKRGETEYAINLIPIGGYVRLFGEAGEGKKKQDSLAHKKPWEKSIIFVAGVFLNVVLAWILLTVFYLVGGRPILPGMNNHVGIIDDRQVSVYEVEKNSPAEKAGIQKDWIIASINDIQIKEISDVSDATQKTKNVNGTKKVKAEFLVNNKKISKTIDTYLDQVDMGNGKVSVLRVGISLNEAGNIRSKWYLAPVAAFQEIGNITKLNTIGLVDFFKKLLFNGELSKDVGGPIAIAQMSGGAARLGVMVLIQFIAILSVALAIMNILPFPALDGGHILFIGIEKIIGKEVPEKIRNTVNLIGFGLLLLLMVVVTFGDLVRIGTVDFIKGIFR